MDINWRLIIAYGVALGLIFGCYAWLGVRSNGAVSFVFLFVLPPIASAFIAALGSIGRDWDHGSFIAVPSILTAAIVLVGGLFLREGVICIAMMAPMWWVLGLAGVWPVYLWRKTQPGNISDVFRANVLLLIPLMALWWESVAPLPEARHTVSTSIVVSATPDRLWPLLQSIPSVGTEEGRWTATHALLQVPRPLDARLDGSGVGAVRHGRWDGGIRFDEVVTRWEPDSALHWRFSFPDASLSNRVDRHLSATGPHSWVERGGYDMTPLPDGRARLTLWTQYRVATPANGYAVLWGQWLLGDIQGNILAIVADRAESTKENQQ